MYAACQGILLELVACHGIHIFYQGEFTKIEL